MATAEEERRDEEEEAEREWEESRIGQAKAFHHEAAKREPAWQGCGLKAGLDIWRIEQFKVKPVNRETYGKFHTGDSYIILHTIEDPESKKISHQIYFWIGSESSIDEQGTAAYKTVELDDYFHHEAHEHREAQDEGESDAFKALFPDGIEYLPGGCPSGFHHVVPEGYHAKLYHIRKHKKTIRRVPVPLKTSCLDNPHDSYVLDAEKAVYVLDGPEAEPGEKFGANEEADHIAAARGTGVHVTHDIDDAFWELLEGDKPSWLTPAKVVLPTPPGSPAEKAVPYSAVPDPASPVAASPVAASPVAAVAPASPGASVPEGGGGGTSVPDPASPVAASPVAASPVAAVAPASPGASVPEGGGGGTSAPVNGGGGKEFYTLEELKAHPAPAGVDPAAKEKRLSDEDFNEVFQMSKEAFAKLAVWKQRQHKQAKGLF